MKRLSPDEVVYIAEGRNSGTIPCKDTRIVRIYLGRSKVIETSTVKIQFEPAPGSNIAQWKQNRAKPINGQHIFELEFSKPFTGSVVWVLELPGARPAQESKPSKPVDEPPGQGAISPTAGGDGVAA